MAEKIVHCTCMQSRDSDAALRFLENFVGNTDLILVFLSLSFSIYSSLPLRKKTRPYHVIWRHYDKDVFLNNSSSRSIGVESRDNPTTSTLIYQNIFAVACLFVCLPFFQKPRGTNSENQASLFYTFPLVTDFPVS